MFTTMVQYLKKGDPLLVAEIAAMNAAKQTHLLIPHCHQIPLDAIKVTFQVFDGSIEARCMVRAQARTGVEMEALVGLSAALNTVWDMVKYLEKDESAVSPVNVEILMVAVTVMLSSIVG